MENDMPRRRVIDYRQFPFLIKREELSDLLRGAPLEQLVVQEDSPIRLRVLQNLEKIVTEGTPAEPSLPLEHEVAAYYALAMLAKSLAERRLYTKIAVAYSKQAGNLLEGLDDETLVGIGQKLGLDVELNDQPHKIPLHLKKGTVVYRALSFSMGLKSYLAVVSARLSQDKKYHISSNVVSKGRVYLDRETYTRVLEEAIYQHVLKTFEALEPLRVDQKLLEEARKIAQVKGAASTDIASEQGVQVVKEDAFPPCVKRAIERLRQGENVSHAERFLIATFLLNIGLEVDQVVELFSSAPDFNEKVTRYQVEHLAGLRGGRKKYSPYSCDKLKALGVCPILDRCDGRNPLSVYYRNLRRGGTGTLKRPGDLVREEVGSVDGEGDHQGGEDEVSDISAHGESYTTS